MLSLWPDPSSSNGSVEPFAEQTIPRVKYDCVTPFNNGNNVPIDNHGLLTLINVGSLRDALFLTTKLLNTLGQGAATLRANTQITPQSLDIWSCRFQLMLALRMHPQLLEELIPFAELDAPDLFFHSQSSALKSSTVPFGLRLVHSEALSFSAAPHSSLERIRRLEMNTEKAREMARQAGANEQELSIWRERLESVRLLWARVLFRLKEYSKAFFAYEQLLATSQCAERRKSVARTLFQMALQFGDEPRSNRYLTQLNTMCGADSAEFAKYSAFKSIFDGNYEKSFGELHNLRVLEPNIVSDPKFCNNEAICLLYSGKAVECLQALFEHPGPVAEPLAMNIATVSDLVSTDSATLKQSYLGRHAQDKNDLFDAQVMRIR